MAALSARYIAELGKAGNVPSTIIELTLDSGVKKFGTHKSLSGVIQCLKSVSSFQNKLDTKSGHGTRGEIKAVIVGREIIKDLVKNDYLKNRRVRRMDGFVTPGFLYTDYALTFAGRISDWSRKGDELTLTISDDMIDATQKVPVENSTNTQTLNYTNTNPVDIMSDLLTAQLGVGASYVETAKFTSEKTQWFNGWVFCRMLTEPKAANEYLNELQEETNSFLFHDGEKITFRALAPSKDETEEWSDFSHIIAGSFSQKSGYKDNFYNRIVVYYDYDESGSDEASNFDSAYISADADSQGAGQWDETKTKTVKSKWIRSIRWSQPSNVTGITIYHASKANGAGTGTLTYTDATNTVTWTPPGDTAGDPVELTADGKYDVYGQDTTKYIRIVVLTSALETSNKTDSITITAISGSTYASALSSRLRNLYRDPQAQVSFEVDINALSSNGSFVKPTDFKLLTTDEACERGIDTWTRERVMVTSIKPDSAKHTASIEAVQVNFYNKYGYIAPAGTPNYGSASEAQKRTCFIRASAPQYYMW